RVSSTGYRIDQLLARRLIEERVRKSLIKSGCKFRAFVANDTNVGSKLHGVVAGDPGEVVRKVVNWIDTAEREGGQRWVEDQAEDDVVAGSVALIANGQARYTMWERFCPVSVNGPGVTDHIAERVTPARARRRIGKLLRVGGANR